MRLKLTTIIPIGILSGAAFVNDRKVSVRLQAKLVLLISAVLLMPPLPNVVQGQEPQGSLVRFLILSRHGVRSPTKDADELNLWRKLPWRPAWPDFGVPPAYLTPHGYDLVVRMGEYYRNYLSGKLFSHDQCPDGVFIWADRDERTLMTAQGLGTGFASASSGGHGAGSEAADPHPCGFAIGQAASQPDPLFHPTQALGLCKLDPGKISLDLIKIHRDLSKDKLLDRAQKILNCCSAELCISHRECPGSYDTCDLPGLPSCVDTSRGSASIKGGLGVAQSFASNLLLEYADKKQFGFGRTSKSEMLEVLKIHTKVFNELQRNEYVAARQGANLLYHLAHAIQYGMDPAAASGENKFIAYVGHDTNIANVAALLNLHWKLPEYPEDDMPPAGALIFEVRQPPDKPEAPENQRVYAFFVAQSADTMRELDTKDPIVVPVYIPCPGAAGSCSVSEFRQLAAKAIDDNNDCMTDWPPAAP